MARSLNKAQIIGNLTRDPELKYTPKGTAVCTFSVATNRQWVTDSGEKKDDVEYHRVVAWAKLAEICAQILTKGRKVYIEGRLQTRSWEGQDNVKRSQTEIVATDMLALDSRGAPTGEYTPSSTNQPAEVPVRDISENKAPAKAPKEVKMDEADSKTPDNEDDIPF